MNTVAPQQLCAYCQQSFPRTELLNAMLGGQPTLCDGDAGLFPEYRHIPGVGRVASPAGPGTCRNCREETAHRSWSKLCPPCFMGEWRAQHRQPSLPTLSEAVYGQHRPQLLARQDIAAPGQPFASTGLSSEAQVVQKAIRDLYSPGGTHVDQEAVAVHLGVNSSTIRRHLPSGMTWRQFVAKTLAES